MPSVAVKASTRVRTACGSGRLNFNYREPPKPEITRPLPQAVLTEKGFGYPKPFNSIGQAVGLALNSLDARIQVLFELIQWNRLVLRQIRQAYRGCIVVLLDHF